ncbi:MAG: ornithine carbamoyltransferase subunit F, partial [Atribacterota bacterium]
MPVNLRNRHLITLKDFTKEEINFLLDLSISLKKAKYSGTEQQKLKGKNIALIFEKASTRTRCAFEVAAFDQGANITYLGPTGSQMGKKESMEDTAKVLGRYYDGIEFRGFKQKSVEILAGYSGAVVWNGLTDQYHPTQVLADLMTIKE